MYISVIYNYISVRSTTVLQYTVVILLPPPEDPVALLPFCVPS